MNRRILKRKGDLDFFHGNREFKHVPWKVTVSRRCCRRKSIPIPYLFRRVSLEKLCVDLFFPTFNWYNASPSWG